MFSRLIQVFPNKNKYMLIEEVILHFMPQIFENYNVESKSLICLLYTSSGAIVYTVKKSGDNFAGFYSLIAIYLEEKDFKLQAEIYNLYNDSRVN